YGTRNGVDAADRRDSKRDTGQKDEEAAQSAAHFTQGKANGQRQGTEAGAARRPGCGRAGSQTAGAGWRVRPRAQGTASGAPEFCPCVAEGRKELLSSIRPARIDTCLEQRAARAGSCVTSTSVIPRSAALENMRSAI